ncbi:hypothetical protein ElyMa_005765200 [Elysia marginata]|uniref:Uncharacterized protein n=1 Tax=Elysia marginata TaxID=1093978 RepID=A0AAV4FQE3_9GAST|nr:hypothetical protein ElyMa_005765200 [Elysia marginata]
MVIKKHSRTKIQTSFQKRKWKATLVEKELIDKDLFQKYSGSNSEKSCADERTDYGPENHAKVQGLNMAVDDVKLSSSVSLEDMPATIDSALTETLNIILVDTVLESSLKIIRSQCIGRDKKPDITWLKQEVETESFKTKFQPEHIIKAEAASMMPGTEAVDDVADTNVPWVNLIQADPLHICKNSSKERPNVFDFLERCTIDTPQMMLDPAGQSTSDPVQTYFTNLVWRKNSAEKLKGMEIAEQNEPERSWRHVNNRRKKETLTKSSETQVESAAENTKGIRAVECSTRSRKGLNGTKHGSNNNNNTRQTAVPTNTARRKNPQRASCKIARRIERSHLPIVIKSVESSRSDRTTFCSLPHSHFSRNNNTTECRHSERAERQHSEGDITLCLRESDEIDRATCNSRSCSSEQCAREEITYSHIGQKCRAR